jgi:PAS domain S-box-containing protein
VSVPLRVLIVEDSEDDAFLLLRELKRGGYVPVHERVDTAPAMGAALERAEWDLVVSDHSMPNFSSSAALELLRGRGFVDLPFIIVSGQIGEDMAVAAMKAGAQDYLMKDNLARLNTAIERELREAEVRRERRRAEEALVESERRFRSLVRNASDVISLLDAGGAIIYQSPSVERVAGYAPEAMLGANVFDYVHPEDVRRARASLERALRHEAPQPPVEYRFRAADGSWLYLESVSTNLLGDPSVRGVVVNTRDITERRRAEEELRRAEERYRGIFENSIEGIFQTSVDGTFLIANPALARMVGYESPEELLASVSNIGAQLYVDPERRAEFDRFIQRDGFVRGFEIQMYRKDGSRMWASASARAIRDEAGELLGYEGTLEDITARKAAEDALREIREEERRRISRELHDVVLQDLTYALQSMQISRSAARAEGREDEELDRQIQALRRSVGGLRDAIYDLRLEGVREQPLVSSVEALVELNRQMAPEREIELIVEEGFPDSLAGVAGVEMTRIVQEALANVRRHSGARRAVVSLGVSDGEVRVEIEDDGRGFERDTAPGMGLTGMRERAAALGGDLAVEGEPGSGTRVVLQVPLSDLVRGEPVES